MPKPPQVKPKELELVILHLGFVRRKGRGSHVIYNHPDGRYTVVPFHNRNVPSNLLRSICKQCKISISELAKLLH